MAKLILTLLCVLLASSAFAWTKCTTRGANTYCDDGTTLHRTPGGGIVDYKTGETHSRYGQHLYSNKDGSWRAKNGKGRVTSSLNHKPQVKDRVLDEIFGNSEDW